MLQAELHTDMQAWPESMILFQLINLFIDLLLGGAGGGAVFVFLC